MDLSSSPHVYPHPSHRSPMPEKTTDRAIASRSHHAAAMDRVQIIETWTNADTRIARNELAPQTRSETVSRVVNVLLATLGIVVAAPLFLIVAAAVKLSSPGPIFYRQARVGIDRRRRGRGGDMLYDRRAKDLGGSVFTIYKFRSM